MKALDALIAAAVGVAVFAAVDVGGQQFGVRTAITPEIWLDGLVYALGALLVRWMLAPLFRGARGFTTILTAILFVPVFAVVTALVGGIADLTLGGGTTQSAFTVTPVNVLLTFFMELWFVAVPAAFIGGLVLVASRRR